MKKVGCIVISALLGMTLATGIGVSLSNKETIKAEAVGKDSYWSSWITNNGSKTGSSFATALHDKIATNTTYGYTNLWSAYATSDVVPGYENDSNANKKIWDMYGGFFFTYQSAGKNYSNAGDCYNREHSIPNSWWGGTEDVRYSDIICLLPTDGKVNNTRSNFMFGEVSSATTTYTLAQRTNKSGSEIIQLGNQYSKLGTAKSINGVSAPESTVFEPADQYKGDFARVYMYFAIRYYGNAQSTSSGQNTFSTSYPYVTNYTKAMLQKWHIQDPVSDKEINRNNAVESLQGNRNPFVDYPQWADKLFDTTYEASVINGGGQSSDPTVSSVTVSPSTWTISLDGTTTKQLSATVSGTNSPAQTVTWTSSNTSVATVSNSGLVTGKAAGTATITATSTVDGTKSGTCAITVSNTGGGSGGSSTDYTLYSGSLTEGNYVIVYDGKAMQNTVSSNRLSYATPTISDDTISNPASGIVWHIAPSGDYWTIYNSAVSQYAASTGTKNQAGLNSSGTDDKSLWTASGNSTYEFVNKNNSANSVNANLRENTTYGFACYATSTGGALSLYKQGSSGSSEPTLSSITLNTDNVKKTFTVGETFIYTGLVVTANYSNSTSEVVTPTSVSSPNMSTAGQKTVTVTYNTVSATYNITVNAAATTSISASVSKTFYVGETITKSDITVKDNNNTTITDFTFSNYQFTYSDAASGGALTNKTFTNAISYNALSCSLTVQVQRKARNDSSTNDYSIFATDLPTTYQTTNISYTSASGIQFDAYNCAHYSASGKLQFKASGGYLQTTQSLNLKTLTIVNRETNALTVYGSNTAGSFSTTISGTNDVYNLQNYKYVKIMKSGSGAAYCTELILTVVEETPANLANYIMYADTSNQCTSKFSVAKGYFENMSSSGRSTFMTSSDYVIATARARFEAWAASLGKTITYTNGDYVVSNARVMPGVISANSSEKLIPIIIAISLATITFVGGYYFLKRKKEK